MSFSLPPGCRFYPSEEHLVSYYLTSKNNGDYRYAVDMIREVDLYSYDPFNLPDAACFRFGRGGRKNHWYCYVSLRVLKEDGRRRKRRAGGGFWLKVGGAKDVVGGGAAKVVVGTRKSFVFYLGDDSLRGAVRTNWVLYEYALIDHHVTSFVLCRVFVRAYRGNNISNNVISSGGEESVAMVRHIGVQYDAAVASVGKANVHDDTIDDKNEILRIPMGLVSRIDDQATSRRIVEQMRSANDLSNDAMTVLEEDFIELNDLQHPLLGADNL